MGDVRFSDAIIKASPRGGASALLTYPIRDVDGDWLNPGGGEWDSESLVNWEHEIPVGRGHVEMMNVPVEGGPRSPVACPMGSTRFFESSRDIRNIDLTRYAINPNGTKGKAIGQWSADICLRTAEDVAELVNADAATGVSVEFIPLKASRTGHISKLTRRPCMNVDEWKLLAWAHCASPRNEGARLLAPELEGVFTKAIHVAETGRLPSGRAIRSEVILKAFSPLKSLSRRPVVRGVTLKADPMMDEGLGDDMNDVGGGDMEQDAAPVESDTPTAQTCHDIAQAYMDVEAHAKQFFGRINNGSKEHELKSTIAAIHDEMQQLVEDGRALAEAWQALGERAEDAANGKQPLQADDGEDPEMLDEDAEGDLAEADEDVDAADADMDEADADMYEADADMDEAEVDEEESEEDEIPTKALPRRIVLDADGLIITKSGYIPRRFRMSELKPVETVEAEPIDSIDETQLKSLQEEITRLNADIRRRERRAARNRR